MHTNMAIRGDVPTLPGGSGVFSGNFQHFSFLSIAGIQKRGAEVCAVPKRFRIPWWFIPGCDLKRQRMIRNQSRTLCSIQKHNLWVNYKDTGASCEGPPGAYLRSLANFILKLTDQVCFSLKINVFKGIKEFASSKELPWSKHRKPVSCLL